MNIVSISNVSKNYKKINALKNLDLDIKQGELFGLLGVNGAGKTTLIKILCGLCKKNDGKVFIDGLDLDKDIDKIKEIVDISPQETSIALNLTVKENLEFFANVYNKSTKQDIDDIINIFSLTQVLDQRAKTLSGGFKRRLSIAVALISKPKLLFLDEPTLGLDVIVRSELWDLINSLKGKVTIILTTHYMEEAEALSDRIAIMKNGRLLICDTADNIKTTANTTNFEQAFINLVRGVEK
jgi:ABC-2 type transport system ATP-binding protein